MSRKTAEFETRQRFILDAAERLFMEKGIENTTMEDIAAAAEYTRRTLYTYFKSRDEILLKVHHEYMVLRWNLQKDAITKADGCLPKLKTWADTLLIFWMEHPCSMKMERYWDYRGITPERIGEETFNLFKRLNVDLADGLRSIFRDGMEDGSLRPDLDVDMCVAQFVKSLRATIYRSMSTAYSFAEFDGRDFFQHFLEIFFRGIHSHKEKE